MNASRLIPSVLATSLGALACTAAPALAATPETPEAKPVTAITAKTATLNGVLNPGGKSEGGSFQFSYALTSAAGTTTSVDHTFIDPTTAVSSGCPDEVVREEDLSTGLPECRAYEMVTPPQKNGALINSLFAEWSVWGPLIARSGTDLMAPSLQCFASPQSCTGKRIVEGEPYEFARAKGQNWVTHPLAPPASQFGITTSWGADADTHTTLFSAPSGSEGPDIFYRREASGVSTRIGPLSEAFENTEQNGRGIIGLDTTSIPIEATSDLSHVVFIGKALWEMVGPNGEGIFEYAGSGNAKPLSVGVTGGLGSTSVISGCSTGIGGNAPLHPANSYGSLSEDGHVVYFTAEGHSNLQLCPEGFTAPATNQLFARIDGETNEAHTVLISGPTPAACTSVECHESTSIANEKASADGRNSEYEGASNDGSRVFFTSTQQLTDNASQGTGNAGEACHVASGPGCNLYESICAEPCGAPAEEPAAKERQLIDITEGAKLNGGPRVQGVMAISPDGSHVYFVARSKLTNSPGVLPGSEAQEGEDNLYVYVEGKPLQFVATLPASDEAELNVPESRQEWDRGGELANVTPDGRFLVFLSHAALTPDDTNPNGPAQIFRYDSETRAIVRISVGEDGFNDDGNAGGPLAEASIVPAEKGWQYPVGPGRTNVTMSDNGQDVFFESPVGLTVGALNEDEVSSPIAVDSVYAENVYEYHDGNVYLISDGKDTTPNSAAQEVVTSTRLIGTDATGKNVFFATNARVIPSEDTDTQRDYYDARVCEEADPCIAPPLVSGSGCSEEACRGPASTPPSSPPAPSSLTFTGESNLPPATKPSQAPAKPKTAAQIRAEKLSKALKQCKKDKKKTKRNKCEKQAKKQFGATKTAKKASHDRRSK